MVCGRKLDQALQILFDFRLRREPDLFPRLMRLPELQAVEVRDAASKGGDEIGFQSLALVPLRRVSHIAAVKAAVVPEPPMSRVRCSGPAARTLTMAS